VPEFVPASADPVGLNLVGVEVVRATEGLGKNGQGLVWSSRRIK
jgi:hypothetical protein